MNTDTHRLIELPDMAFCRAQGWVAATVAPPAKPVRHQNSRHPELAGLDSDSAEYRTRYTQLYRAGIISKRKNNL